MDTGSFIEEKDKKKYTNKHKNIKKLLHTAIISQ